VVRELDTSKYDVTIVSPRNYFLFTPLLPSVTVGTLDPKAYVRPLTH
jgi:NADH dehydrogenase FAD-containing subunit